MCHPQHSPLGHIHHILSGNSCSLCDVPPTIIENSAAHHARTRTIQTVFLLENCVESEVESCCAILLGSPSVPTLSPTVATAPAQDYCLALIAGPSLAYTMSLEVVRDFFSLATQLQALFGCYTLCDLPAGGGGVGDGRGYSWLVPEGSVLERKLLAEGRREELLTLLYQDKLNPGINMCAPKNLMKNKWVLYILASIRCLHVLFMCSGFCVLCCSTLGMMFHDQ